MISSSSITLRLGVAEYAQLFGEAQVGRGHQAGVLVQLGQQAKEQVATGLVEQQIARLIEKEQIYARQCLFDPPGFAVVLFALQGIGQDS